MRERELRRLFLGLVAAAIPVGLTGTGCGGVTTDRSGRSNFENGDAAASSGGSVTGSGGRAPMFFGTGGLPQPPVFAGAGSGPVYPGTTGGVYGYPPIYTGGGGSPPIYMGVGGSPHTTGGAPPVYTGVVDAAAVPDAMPVDAQATDAPADAGCSTRDDGAPRCTGRRPPGLLDSPVATGGDLCAFFEEMSRLEAASVPAFRVLARELKAHGAPRHLIRAARRAARDEIRHTRMGALLAERFGGRYVRPRIVAKPMRSIEAIATDNAAEGCVRETFGALVATWQAKAASDPIVRRIMRRVAVDETRHAALALGVAAWADRKLDAPARLRVRNARRRAAAQVMQELSYQPSQALASVAGVPKSDEARSLAAALTERLWS